MTDEYNRDWKDGRLRSYNTNDLPMQRLVGFCKYGDQKKNPTCFTLNDFLKKFVNYIWAFFFFFLESTFGQFENINNCR